MNAIEINGLSKVYPISRFSRQPGTAALTDISLEIPKGALYTLLGPNGAGKSTLIRILAGLTPVTKGNFKLNGRLGLFMSGVQGFWEALDGRTNLNYFCALQNLVGSKARNKVDEVIDIFEMGAYVDRPVKIYSNGMKHRLLLARTLLNDPDILLLDEPITYLDPIGAREFHLLLRDRLNRTLGKTILLSTHQLEEAQEISDTLGFLFQGKLLWEKKASTFRDQQANLLEDYFQTVKNQPS